MKKHVRLEVRIQSAEECDSDKGHAGISVTLGEPELWADMKPTDSQQRWREAIIHRAGLLARIASWAEPFVTEQRRTHGCEIQPTRHSLGPMHPPEYGDRDMCSLNCYDLLRPTADAAVYLTIDQEEISVWKKRVKAWLAVLAEENSAS
ncbi:hypothetical protein [Nakamurella sp. PAMC28650]|uniref:hypothetical protein n=1 Tax=Nakamurella sp. PAMC28650 TaxID=2762325 RepID=UPI00164D99BF|nr:hypothetical protein [Nakamurella sp. PAMC28650]QNK79309.1 hypothetical protein H7F38_13350 [Nakamurella sp. PAMC28650]